jgi:hypothetical protein
MTFLFGQDTRFPVQEIDSLPHSDARQHEGEVALEGHDDKDALSVADCGVPFKQVVQVVGRQLGWNYSHLSR